MLIVQAGDLYGSSCGQHWTLIWFLRYSVRDDQPDFRDIPLATHVLQCHICSWYAVHNYLHLGHDVFSTRLWTSWKRETSLSVSLSWRGVPCDVWNERRGNGIRNWRYEEGVQLHARRTVGFVLVQQHSTSNPSYCHYYWRLPVEFHQSKTPRVRWRGVVNCTHSLCRCCNNLLLLLRFLWAR